MMLKHTGISVYKKQVVDIFETISKADISIKTIDNWVALVENHASSIGVKIENTDDRIKMQNEFRGDMLEILAEIFFKNSSFDDRFGLSNYIVADSTSDYGVDATGYNVNGHKCAVQCKYRANPKPQGDDQIKYEDLTKTYFDGRENHNCDLDKPHTVFLFTTANTYSCIIDANFKKKLVFIGRNQLSEIIHQNVNFWNICIKEIQDYLEN
jgi:hypothetical protein